MLSILPSHQGSGVLASNLL
ncbi:Protein of unknown function [Pyronema omphalodes CBS 100304]|uniref:Uncharacterized protein n=1 Tax=Pyronema omphalodes (strain CBS 100304) TaxID=1076935 RepID=U4KVB5_PYROM|nr:Protein of unknown function [Pyronema omphalodes CBS 100304]